MLYIATLSVGYICMLMAGTWMSRLLKNNLMEDVFNMENESFQQFYGMGKRAILTALIAVSYTHLEEKDISDYFKAGNTREDFLKLFIEF